MNPALIEWCRQFNRELNRAIPLLCDAYLRQVRRVLHDARRERESRTIPTTTEETP